MPPRAGVPRRIACPFCLDAAHGILISEERQLYDQWHTGSTRRKINLERLNDLADQVLDPLLIEGELTGNLQTKVIKVAGSERVLAPSSCI
jgi:hypothetical protein